MAERGGGGRSPCYSSVPLGVPRSSRPDLPVAPATDAPPFCGHSCRLGRYFEIVASAAKNTWGRGRGVVAGLAGRTCPASATRRKRQQFFLKSPTSSMAAIRVGWTQDCAKEEGREREMLSRQWGSPILPRAALSAVPPPARCNFTSHLPAPKRHCGRSCAGERAACVRIGLSHILEIRSSSAAHEFPGEKGVLISGHPLHNGHFLFSGVTCRTSAGSKKAYLMKPVWSG